MAILNKPTARFAATPVAENDLTVRTTIDFATGEKTTRIYRNNLLESVQKTDRDGFILRFERYDQPTPTRSTALLKTVGLVGGALVISAGVSLVLYKAGLVR